jgi:hypothetical protein
MSTLGLIGPSLMPAYKKRKLTSITNLGSWIKSKGSKKLKTDDYNKDNVGHFIIRLIAGSSHLLGGSISFLYEAKQLPYLIQLGA